MKSAGNMLHNDVSHIPPHNARLSSPLSPHVPPQHICISFYVYIGYNSQRTFLSCCHLSCSPLSSDVVSSPLLISPLLFSSTVPHFSTLLYWSSSLIHLCRTMSREERNSRTIFGTFILLNHLQGSFPRPDSIHTDPRSLSLCHRLLSSSHSSTIVYFCLLFNFLLFHFYLCRDST